MDGVVDAVGHGEFAARGEGRGLALGWDELALVAIAPKAGIHSIYWIGNNGIQALALKLALGRGDDVAGLGCEANDFLLGLLLLGKGGHEVRDVGEGERIG